MARGNDAAAAREELEKKLGVEVNAEGIIRANKARFSRELRAANNKRLDLEATEALDPKAVDRAAPGTVLDYAVRGGMVVIVYIDADTDRSEKVALPLSQVKGGGKRAEPKEAPKVETGAAAAKARAKAKAEAEAGAGSGE